MLRPCTSRRGARSRNRPLRPTPTRAQTTPTQQLQRRELIEGLELAGARGRRLHDAHPDGYPRANDRSSRRRRHRNGRLVPFCRLDPPMIRSARPSARSAAARAGSSSTGARAVPARRRTARARCRRSPTSAGCPVIRTPAAASPRSPGRAQDHRASPNLTSSSPRRRLRPACFWRHARPPEPLLRHRVWSVMDHLTLFGSCRRVRSSSAATCRTRTPPRSRASHPLRASRPGCPRRGCEIAAAS